MIGITSFGGYIPRLRMNRMSIYESMGWFAPALVMVAQGERSFGNWDEDALTMAVAAGRDCLTGLDRAKIDAVYLGSTTMPFADRQCAGIVKTALNLRDDLVTADFTTGLRAGTTALLTALSAVKGGERSNILVTASDMRQTKSATFYEMWFGDGAASVLVGDDRDGAPVVAEYKGSHTVSHDFVDHYRGAGRATDYTWEERWVRDEGYAKIIPEAVNGLLAKLKITMDDVDTLVYPCFFKAEHKNIAKTLGAAPGKVADNMHDVAGEMGAAHPLVMLVRALEAAKPGDRILVAGFGQGCDALYFQVTDAITALPARTGVQGSLEHKLTVENYPQFLKFRDLIDTDLGIRAEAPTQTAPTVLWRKRNLLTGFMGGKCAKCGTAQLPKSEICVNPDCRAVRAQEDHPFADQPAFVKTFTGDMLAVSVNPPHIYGMVQFEEGGRFMADFTDCTLDDVSVGAPVRMVFRKRYVDEERGFTGYFWKAIPLPSDTDPDAIRLDGQVAIVTGAGAGLGKAYALELAGRGAKVVVNDLGGARDGAGKGSSTPADDVVKEIQDAGGEAVANYDSVSDPAGAAGIIKTAIDTYGRIDIVVNNAGILRDKSLIKMEPADWQSVLAVHLDGAFFVTRAALPHMRERGYGRIILTTSAAGLYGNFGQTNYSAAKLGLVGLMNTAKLEGKKYDIKVNTVAPLATTRLTDDILPPDLQDKLQPEFVVPLVTYLASDRCTVTGEVFNAGMGYFNRAAIVAGPGTVIGDGKRVPTVEELHAVWDEIASMDGAKEYGDATSALGAMLDAFAPKAKAEAAPGGAAKITCAKVFEQMPSAFLADKAAGVEVVFQYDISGEGGGSWNVTIANNECLVAEGKHEQPTTTIKMAASDFLDLISGKLNAMKAFTSGKLKIGGDVMKSQLIEKLFKF
ncbi:MAG: SDR family NAD(P)-dependent oxidoreductase [bacterium]